MQIVAIVEPYLLGYKEAGMIGINDQADMIQEVTGEVAKLPEVSCLFQAASEIDLFAKFYCLGREDYIFS